MGMKLFDGGRAPNPRRVRVFLAEKGIEVPLVAVDMGALGHKQEPVSSRNPLQRLPVLELDDGTIITESVAICRYFEELHPEPALFGQGALGKAQVEMWQRRMEFNLLSCVAQAFRHIHPATTTQAARTITTINHRIASTSRRGPHGNNGEAEGAEQS
jgi:glutathione S-transferase